MPASITSLAIYKGYLTLLRRTSAKKGFGQTHLSFNEPTSTVYVANYHSSDAGIFAS